MPPQTAVPGAFNTAEFRRSDGPLEHNAVAAWSAGRVGTGVTIAVVDTGVDPDNPEFAGRYSPLSRDILGASRPLAGSDDHGTHVALVAAAARNGTGIVGMAHGATIMALRTDTVGSCGADTPGDTDEDCSFSDTNIASAIDFASSNGAKVINVSLGGEGANLALRNAVTTAANRGSLIVISAGNEGEAQPDSFALQLDTAASGGVIIVGSIGASGEISSFSNRAGSQNAHFMTALGERVCCSYENGQIYTDSEGFIYLMNGTSFSAPQVSGAAALLAQAFPTLTGRQIAQILLDSAFDAGAPGADAIYGRGILDIAKAFQPSGLTTLPGGTAVAMADSTGAGSSAMGDAFSTASLHSIVLDKYGRAFSADLAGTLRGAPPSARVGAAVGVQRRNLAFGTDDLSVALTIDASDRRDDPHIAPLRLSNDDAAQAHVLATRVTTRLDANWQLALGFRDSAAGLTAQLQDHDRGAFLIAPAAGRQAADMGEPATALALRHTAGPWGVTLSMEQGEWLSGASVRRASEQYARRFRGEAASMGLALDRRFGAVDTTLGLTWLAEDETLLGGRFHDAFGLSGAETLFLDAGLGWTLAPGWRLGAGLRQGWSRAEVGGAIAGGSHLISRAWSLDLTRADWLVPGDSLGLRVSQPLRVESGGIAFRLPTAWDYATLTADYTLQDLSLAPTGRELLGELAWQGPLLAGQGSVSLFYRRDPGHYAALPDDVGAVLRWGAKF